jgi:choice-of-anchor B domain-containing protein
MGLDIGTAVVDVTDPENPFEIGLALGPMAVWRDIKVYQFFDAATDRWKAYAYVTTDGSNDGMIVIDLTGLPHEIERMDYASDFTAAHNVYATGLDFGTGLSQTGTTPSLIIAGPNMGSGRYRAYSLADPLQPSFIGAATSPDYMHDAASMLITDARKDTQCANATTYCEILFDFNETTVDIWDITDISDPQRLSRTPYANSGYVHSGWWSEDNQYMFVHDELDEQRSGLQTTLRVFSLDDLRAPTLAATWTGATAAIDHNGFVRGSRYYMSNYSQGLTILDISDPTQPSEVGRIDTYPFSESANFVGAWGTYPYFPSGTIAISDIDSGFYLVRDQTRSVAAGSLSFSSASYAASEGGQATLTVQRNGGSTGNVSVDYQILAATADAADYQLVSGILSWSVGDATDKSITLTIPDDSVAEPMEHLIVRLISPGGGATLGDVNTTNLFLSDAGAQSGFGFLDTIVESSETGMNTVILVVQRSGSATGQASVDYAVSGGDASVGLDFDGDTNGTLVWADGDGQPKSLTISIIDDSDAETTEFFEVTLSNPQGGTLAATSRSRVNISSNESPTPPPPPATPPPTSSGGGGGGSPAPVLLVLLAVSLLRRNHAYRLHTHRGA